MYFFYFFTFNFHFSTFNFFPYLCIGIFINQRFNVFRFTVRCNIFQEKKLQSWWHKLFFMNLYIRYFEQDALATTMDEVVAFLETVKDLKLTGDVINRVNSFYLSNNQYPYRLKVGYSNYILFLKTEANTLEEFKEMERIRNEQKAAGTYVAEKKKSVLELMAEENPGWYDAILVFKRVVPIKDTNKFQYLDTRFHAKLKAQSALDCYERIVNHLRNRQDVDSRSQYPSAKSSNFEYTFLGDTPNA